MKIDDFRPAYRHAQTGPWWLLLLVLGLMMMGLAWSLRDVSGLPVIFGMVGPFMLVGAACFQRLTVEDANDHLSVHFGPVPLLTKRIRYEDMETVEVARTTLLDGWGIHKSLRGGWVWNIWGRACVRIRHGGTTWLGTDDAEALVLFLETKMDHRESRS
jgi:hypothetical protein